MSVFDEMVTFVKVANRAKKFIVACMEGPTGIGKTAAINQAAKELAEDGKATGRVVTIIASQILPNEVSGITMPVTENKSMEIFDHYRLSSLQDGDILFFDELLEADQLVLSACLTLIESRQMMSGKPLPDIQIVAATNSTIKPNMLKENIRQRFVWKKFDIDRNGCASYIERTYGLNVRDLVKYITDSGDEYNILTPRSLTKMAGWINEAENEMQASEIGAVIDSIWNSSLGSNLYKAWKERELNPNEQMRRALVDSVNHVFHFKAPRGIMHMLDKDNFNKETSVKDLMELLKSLDEWGEIEECLSKLEVVEVSVETDVRF